MRRALFALFMVSACGPSGSETGGDPDAPPAANDLDDDGYSGDEDCNESDPTINAGAFERCNQFDDNCNGDIDEGFDADQDGFFQCTGDCNDNDATIRPNAQDLCDDGIDSDCNPTTSSDFDNDLDGWTVCDGDCDDVQPLVNPAAVEVQIRTLEDGTEEPELVDNDCDGMVDEALEPCDSGLLATVAGDYAKAIEICGPWVTSATFNVSADPQSRNILPDYGMSYIPHAGAAIAVLSSGIAKDADQPGYVVPQSGTAFTNSGPHPDPLPAQGCNSADPAQVNDIVEYTLEIDVPANALSFSFDFNFMSAEFPEWVCSSYDDTFIAYLESSAYTGNISFDAMGNPVSVNIGFFTVCDQQPSYPTETANCMNGSDLLGTGYEGTIGGGTGWLTTTAPVEPGEHIRLRFIVFDEGDHILDSAVLLDNFRWEAVAVDAPVTIPKIAPPRLGR